MINDWLYRVEQEPDLTCISMNFEERTGHLPTLMSDVIKRLRLDEGTKEAISAAAATHGDLRRKQGYTVAMLVGSLAFCRLLFLRRYTKTLSI